MPALKSAVLALALLATPLAAQDADPAADARNRLNAQQAETARQQVEANMASIRAYEEAVKAHQAAVKAYEEAVAAQKSEAERIQADYAAAMKRWEADVAACKHGDRSKCAPPAKKN